MLTCLKARRICENIKMHEDMKKMRLPGELAGVLQDEITAL